ncbi:hypothetical protein vBPFY1MI_81 [Pseudomonas phage vB_PF_Y1-MI]|nr:hypothetical protein vBPFY1MI_81 [Pseudomonas phage vB_PF_Y1-MI]
MTKILCMMGWHNMELKVHAEKERSSFSARKLKYVQCKWCKEMWK